MKQLEKCISLVDSFARVKDLSEDQMITRSMEQVGLMCNPGIRFMSKISNERFQPLDHGIFPDWMLGYMENIIHEFDTTFQDGGCGYLSDPRFAAKCISDEKKADAGAVAILNTYKAEYFRSCAKNFLIDCRTVIRLTDECAEYINDIGVSRVSINDLNFPFSKFSLSFRMDNRDFCIMVTKHPTGIRMFGFNNAEDPETEPAFASHDLIYSETTDIKKLCKEESEKWKLHLDISGWKYKFPSRGQEIIQHRMRAFVLKFMLMYSHRIVESRREEESIKKIRLAAAQEIPVSGKHNVIYVSLGISEKSRMETHREIVKSLSGTDRSYKVDMWPVVAHIRKWKDKVLHIPSYWARRRAGGITKDMEVVVRL
jgi:hypothetical protein